MTDWELEQVEEEVEGELGQIHDFPWPLQPPRGSNLSSCPFSGGSPPLEMFVRAGGDPVEMLNAGFSSVLKCFRIRGCRASDATKAMGDSWRLHRQVSQTETSR